MNIGSIILIFLFGFIVGFFIIKLYMRYNKNLNVKKKYSFGNEITSVHLKSDAKKYYSKHEEYAAKDY